MSDHNGADRHDTLEAAQQQAREDVRGEPIFEVVIRSAIALETPKHHLKIWGDGYMEGFEGLGASFTVVNRYPLMMDQVVQPLRDWVEDMDRALDALAPREPTP